MKLYGLAAEFETPEELLEAVRNARRAGYRQMDGYSPFPIDGLAQALAYGWTPVPLIVLVAGIAGGIGGYLLQWWSSTADYPINVGGRPLHSWPAFLPITFELIVLTASLIGLAALFILNGFPRPYHPMFNIEAFAQATSNRFFLCIEATDARFDDEATRAFLRGMSPMEVYDVPE